MLAADSDLPANDRRQGNSDRTLPFGLRNNLCDYFGDSLWGCWLRGGDFYAFINKLTGLKVNAGAFDAGATDINSKSSLSHAPKCTNYFGFWQAIF